MNEKIKKLEELRSIAKQGGGKEKIEEQHKKGKLTARERLEILLDDFDEIDMFITHQTYDFDMYKKKILTDGVITGFGTIDGRKVAVFSQDFTVFGGTVSKTNAQKIVKIMQTALRIGIPIIGLNDSGGARIQEGVSALGGYGDIFLHNVLASGVVPQISAILGPCAGGAVYSPALTDFIFMKRITSYMFITGPDVVKAVMHQDVSFEELGGADVHGEISGIAHFVYDSEEELLLSIRTLLSYLPSNNMENPPSYEITDDPYREIPELDDIIPDDPKEPYDVKDIIRKIVDEGSFFEIQENFAKNIVIGFARIGGKVVGIVANQPLHLSGALDIKASVKAARFVRFCDSFNIPIITFVDVPGFMPGIDQEHGGIIKEGAKLIFAYAEAVVPKITIILKKAYGGAYDVMGSKHLRADINLAWPSAEIAVMGPEGAVKILYKKEIEKLENLEEFIKIYKERFANPYYSANLGYIDDVIRPSQTRKIIYRYLTLLENKRQTLPYKKHSNEPL
ncbi:MAG: acyl-CoA carboxylase subunit beta [candidate division WOR-3 bacterium]|nr:acyl-CoA carboxylase subunit beta [candidate division WOR-3 bacterium]MCX7948315.1 acyl-CoA carboxylase subunit beta [candidate division WOR-3 bacterium]MDW8151139.1 acyl-CoA carboxylase subunit beta [candidate division WOR-3 bacterium]